jgi:large subunit ribosomal protein L9
VEAGAARISPAERPTVFIIMNLNAHPVKAEIFSVPDFGLSDAKAELMSNKACQKYGHPYSCTLYQRQCMRRKPALLPQRTIHFREYIMATTNLLLVKPVDNLGNEGEQVKVRAGFARNYLLPRGIGIPVTRANRKQIEVLHARAEVRRKQELEVANALAAKMANVKIAIAVKTGPGGKVFGAVTAQDIANRLKDEGLVIDKKQIFLHSPARSLGQHKTRIRLHQDVVVDFEFEIVSENPIEEAPAEEQQPVAEEKAPEANEEKAGKEEKKAKKSKKAKESTEAKEEKSEPQA